MRVLVLCTPDAEAAAKEAGADFFEVVRQMKDVLGANACPVVIPIGAEESLDVYKRQEYPCSQGRSEFIRLLYYI